jgi:hypothetical protein
MNRSGPDRKRAGGRSVLCVLCVSPVPGFGQVCNMASLVLVQGPKAGPFLWTPRRRSSAADPTRLCSSVAGRQPGARILCEGEDFFVEDIGSSNGTFLNGRRITERAPCATRRCRSGHVFTLKPEPAAADRIGTGHPQSGLRPDQ